MGVVFFLSFECGKTYLPRMGDSTGRRDGGGSGHEAQRTVTTRATGNKHAVPTSGAIPAAKQRTLPSQLAPTATSATSASALLAASLLQPRASAPKKGPAFEAKSAGSQSTKSAEAEGKTVGLEAATGERALASELPHFPGMLLFKFHWHVVHGGCE